MSAFATQRPWRRADHPRCSRFCPDPHERRTFQHRHGFLVPGDRHVEDGLGQPDLVPEDLVDGLDGHAGLRGDSRQRRADEAAAEEQSMGGLD